MKQKKYVYYFGTGKAEGRGDMKDLLGGKGAGLAEMTRLGIPVPAGFTITTQACVEYFKNGKRFPKGMWEQALRNLKDVEQAMGMTFGDSERPLLVSVRSGAKASMPGMMDTVLNLGLNEQTLKGIIRRTGNERFAYDAYRRFITMFGSIVMEIKREQFEHLLDEEKKRKRAKLDTDLGAEDMKSLTARYKNLVKHETGREFPDDPFEQLKMAIDAVFNSWFGARAVTYRRLQGIPDGWGTAVNIVAMVFGNMGDTSGTGVAFTRDPSNGERRFFGECLMNAQGEDVVAGIRTPLAIEALAKTVPPAYRDLLRVFKKLERHYRDMLDLEFTIQEGKLYMLQTRVGKRTGLAAVKIAVDMVKEKLITKEEAILRVSPDQIAQYLYPIFDSQSESAARPVGRGLPAGPGAAAGKIVLTPDKAVKMREDGERVILVRRETSPDDIHGMDAAMGFLTAKGGMTSHAAVVARQMGKVCVAGCEAVEVNEAERTVKIGPATLKEGDSLSIDGFTGQVYAQDLPVVSSEVTQVIQGKMKPHQSQKYRYFATILGWADRVRRLRIRANADIPDQANIARGFGAEGIGLCRTEHMFFAEDRISIMKKMILSRTREEREQYLDKLLPLQKSDFLGLYHKMQGYPVTIRLLDPPLHEFLPKREELMVEIAGLEATRGDRALLEEKRKLLARVEELHEFNPMLGLRGCRLGITMPEITRMQVRAIMEAACEIAREGKKIVPEIMVPLVGMVTEMRAQKDLVRKTADEVIKQYGVKLKYLVGTMIELPRAAVTAGQIAKEAEFFSFGTNDMTQTTYGFSRDDAAKFIQFYMTTADLCPNCHSSEVDKKTNTCRSCGFVITEQPANIIEFDPFATLDQEGVGYLMRLAAVAGRNTRKNIKLGICGEHGGDPASIEFCHRIGLDYVSCSPYRVPIARLAAAHAVLKNDKKKKREKRI
ncbi:MAG TPA: pyruvate, phosphate dikinase [Nitrospiria bacterium]|nr:pyruvate, phosphate dikinase [Nitrospiria bacterium]HUK56460.1 pyruvate, phosphate dikinase [Nitrospiria bacterium]